jgi:transposase
MNREALRGLDKEALIDLILAQAEAIKALTARVAELEAKLGEPPKTPDNSSLPPSKGQKPSALTAPKPKAQAHAGAHRPLHPNPTSRREFRAERCQRCGVDVADAPQFACESYDRIEIPAITPDVTRVTLMGGVCPCCGKRFKATPPADLAPGSPFGANLRAFVIYLRSVQGIALARLVVVLHDLFGLDISEGALVAILDDSRKAFAAQTSAIKARLLSGTALACDGPVGTGEAEAFVSARPTGGCGCFITVRTPCSSSIPIARRRSCRPSSGVGDRSFGFPTASAAREAGRGEAIKSASRI